MASRARLVCARDPNQRQESAGVNGTMIWFHEERGEGFLRADDGERLPVDIDGFVGRAAPVGRCAGLPVTFAVAERDGVRVAVDVSLVENEIPRRARRRASGMRGGG
jgi:hypothetical protein